MDRGEYLMQLVNLHTFARMIADNRHISEMLEAHNRAKAFGHKSQKDFEYDGALIALFDKFRTKVISLVGESPT